MNAAPITSTLTQTLPIAAIASASATGTAATTTGDAQAFGSDSSPVRLAKHEFRAWDVDAVCVWLETIGMPDEVIGAFRTRGVVGAVLPLLSEHVLRAELQVRSPVLIRRLRDETIALLEAEKMAVIRRRQQAAVNDRQQMTQTQNQAQVHQSQQAQQAQQEQHQQIHQTQQQAHASRRREDRNALLNDQDSDEHSAEHIQSRAHSGSIRLRRSFWFLGQYEARFCRRPSSTKVFVCAIFLLLAFALLNGAVFYFINIRIGFFASLISFIIYCVSVHQLRKYNNKSYSLEIEVTPLKITIKTQRLFSFVEYNFFQEDIQYLSLEITHKTKWTARRGRVQQSRLQPFIVLKPDTQMQVRKVQMWLPFNTEDEIISICQKLCFILSVPYKGKTESPFSSLVPTTFMDTFSITETLVERTSNMDGPSSMFSYASHLDHYEPAFYKPNPNANPAQPIAHQNLQHQTYHQQQHQHIDIHQESYVSESPVESAVHTDEHSFDIVSMASKGSSNIDKKPLIDGESSPAE